MRFETSQFNEKNIKAEKIEIMVYISTLNRINKLKIIENMRREFKNFVARWRRKTGEIHGHSAQEPSKTDNRNIETL